MKNTLIFLHILKTYIVLIGVKSDKSQLKPQVGSLMEKYF